MMYKLVLLAIAFVASISATEYGQDYKQPDYGNDYNDYQDSSSSSEEEKCVRIPAGKYYICTKSTFGSKRCLTYKQTPAKPDDSSSSDDCPNKQDSSSSEDPYVEANRYRYIYASKQYASLFELSYANSNTCAFTLSCESCKNEHHGSAVTLVRRHLEFSQSECAPVDEFIAYKADKEGTKFNVRTAETTHLINKWWQVSTFRKRMEIGIKLRASKLQFYRVLNGAAYTA